MKKLISLLSLSLLMVACNEGYSIKQAANVTGGAGGGGGPITCPAEYVKIPFNSAVGTTKDFCVAKYEMKNVSGAAVSQISSTPWGSITATNAMTACQVIGPGYDLISNAEWMTIARNVENVNTNWSSNTVGTGELSMGSYSFCDANHVYTDYSCGPASTNFQYKRTFDLSNGELIWDFAGNFNEWVDWEVETPTNTFTLAHTIACPHGYHQVNDVSTLCPSVLPASKVSSSDTGLTSTNGIGQINLGYSTGGTGGTSGGGGGPGAVFRSGGGSGGVMGGAFTTDFGYDQNSTNFNLGFRCVYRGN